MGPAGAGYVVEACLTKYPRSSGVGETPVERGAEVIVEVFSNYHGPHQLA